MAGKSKRDTINVLFCTSIVIGAMVPFKFLDEHTFVCTVVVTVLTLDDEMDRNECKPMNKNDRETARGRGRGTKSVNRERNNTK